MPRTPLGLVLLAVVMVLALPDQAGAVTRFFARHRTPSLAIVIAATVAGFVLLMAGTMAVAVAGGSRRIRRGASVAEMKAAMLSGAWKRDPAWRPLFAAFAGAALLVYGVFGIFVVVGPPVVKVLCAGAVAYVSLRTAAAFRAA